MYNEKTPIKIFDFELNYLTEIDNYKSLIFRRCYNDYSTFSISIALNKKNTKYLEENNIILIDRDNNKTGIILDKKIKLDNDGKEILQIKGATLNWILNKRKILLTDDQTELRFNNTYVDDIIYQLLNDNIVNAKDTDRNISNLVIKSNENKLGNKINFITKVDNLSTKVSELCKNNDLGYKIITNFEKKQFEFILYKSIDLTQDNENLVVFSPRMGNIKAQEYNSNNINNVNICYLKINGRTHKTGEAKGIERNETYIEHDTVEGTETIEDIAVNEINKNNEIDSLEGEIIPNRAFIYEEDYNLGNIVVVENTDWHISKNLRITEIEEIYEVDKNVINFIFGQTQETAMKRIKNSLNIVESKTFNKVDNTIIAQMQSKIAELESKINELQGGVNA